MTDTPEKPAKASNAKRRPDDARGAPKGGATTPQPHGGAIGQPQFVPTEAQRQQVRTLAKTFPATAERYIARLVGVSLPTLKKYFDDDIEYGRAEMLAGIGAQVIAAAMDGNAEVAKGDRDLQKFTLTRLGGWSTKQEVSGPNGGPIETRAFDLSGLSAEDKAKLLPVLDQLIAQADDGDSSDPA